MPFCTYSRNSSAVNTPFQRKSFASLYWLKAFSESKKNSCIPYTLTDCRYSSTLRYILFLYSGTSTSFLAGKVPCCSRRAINTSSDNNQSTSRVILSLFMGSDQDFLLIQMVIAIAPTVKEEVSVTAELILGTGMIRLRSATSGSNRARFQLNV